MSAHSKKETEDMYGGMFGDLSALASDDTGEINSFANDVINREVNASWRRRFVDSLQLGLRHKGDMDKFRARQLFDEQQQIKGTLEAVENGWFRHVMKDPSIRYVFETEIDEKAQEIVRLAIQRADPAIVHRMNEKKGEIVQRVKDQIMSSVKSGKITDDKVELIVSVDKKVRTGRGMPDIELDKVTLNRSDFQNRINEIKVKQDVINKKVDEVEKRINKRPVKGDTKNVNGQQWKFNGVKWVLIGTAAATAWFNRDKIQGGIEGMFKNNQGVEIGPINVGSDSDSGSSQTDPESSSGYDPFKAHETSPGVMDKVNPGGANTPQAPRTNRQDAWNKLKTPPPAQQRRFESDSDYENGWWNAPRTSKPQYDDMGYEKGGADESWIRTAKKSSPSPDELSDYALDDYGADQMLSAQSLLSFYGLGTGVQPGKRVIESLLMGAFQGQSFEEYKRTHSEDEVRQAMKGFEQGLRKFSEEMGELARGLDSFYEERQRRLESKQSKPVQPNEQPQRTE